MQELVLCMRWHGLHVVYMNILIRFAFSSSNIICTKFPNFKLLVQDQVRAYCSEYPYWFNKKNKNNSSLSRGKEVYSTQWRPHYNFESRIQPPKILEVLQCGRRQLLIRANTQNSRVRPRPFPQTILSASAHGLHSIRRRMIERLHVMMIERLHVMII